MRSKLHPMSLRFLGFLTVPTLAALLIGGCFRGENLGKIHCVTDDNCPVGFACMDSTKPGGCRRTGDERLHDAAVDLVPTVDGRSAIDESTADTGPEDQRPEADAGQPSADLGGAESADVGVGSGDSGVGLDTLSSDAIADSSRLSADSSDQVRLDATQSGDVPLDLPAADSAVKAIGTPCQDGNECGSTYCVDGYCCDGPCAGQCQSCGVQAAPGTCTTVTGAAPTGKPACGGAGACAGTCDGQSSCSFPGAETSCGAASCASGVATSGRSCDGAGICRAATTKPCGTYVCGSTSCLYSCTSAADCVAGAVCSGGTCVACRSGETVCANQCVNLKTDNNHCGSCSAVACASGRQCTAGVCKLVDGQACTSDSECSSAVCSRFYYDYDGDGYPVSGNTIGYCNLGTSPNSRYIPPRGDGSWDCCDTDSTVSPGVSPTTFFIDASNECHTWDWNCSGQAEKKQVQMAGACWFDSSTSACVSTTAPGYPSADCGGAYVASQGCAVTTPGNCTSTSSQNAPVACH